MASLDRGTSARVPLGRLVPQTNPVKGRSLKPPRLWDRFTKLPRRVDDLDQRVDDVDQRVQGLSERLQNLGRRLGQHDLDIERLQASINDSTSARVWAVMDWVRRTNLDHSLLISVVTPTRNRVALLARAVGSVIQQSFANWEMIVVDDHSDGDFATVADHFADDRIRCVSNRGDGQSDARNTGLGLARGSIVAYLDDDNEMHPEWLRTVIWAFDRNPALDVLYGARLWERDEAILGDELASDLPYLDFRPFDRALLERFSYIDVNSLAHRAGLPEAHFDRDFGPAADYDLAIRLTRDKAPLALPAIACYYYTSAPERATDTSGGAVDDLRRIWAKHGLPGGSP